MLQPVMLLMMIYFLSSCALKDNRMGKELKSNQYEVFGKIYETMSSADGYIEIGVASWYGKKFHGNLTASGEIYDMNLMTAAHKALPLPTMVKVTNLNNGKKAVVRVNDRGPFHDNRVIDLSYAAAVELDFLEGGVTSVVVEAVNEMPSVDAYKLKEAQKKAYIQVGAFKKNLAAKDLSNELRSLFPETISVGVISQTENSELYKVWIGPLIEEKQKLYVLKTISEKGFERPLYITE